MVERMLAYEGQADSVDGGVLPDGRRLWRFSQSKVKQVDTCPERGRRTMLGLMGDGATDSNALGRAVHAAIEACLTDMIDGMGPWALQDMIDVACEDFSEEMALPSSRWVKYKNASTLHKQIGRCLTTWYQRVMPTLHPLAVEVNFGPMAVHEDDLRVIEIRGQIDYIDMHEGLMDWKTTGREWVDWEHKRWDLQPTMYTFARSGAFDAANMLAEEPPFDYLWVWHVLNVDGSYQKIETTRNRDDWAWMKDRLVVIAKTLEADLPEWPKNDTHALCSAQWCGAFSACKGLYMPVGWPKHKK